MLLTSHPVSVVFSDMSNTTNPAKRSRHFSQRPVSPPAVAQTQPTQQSVVDHSQIDMDDDTVNEQTFSKLLGDLCQMFRIITRKRDMENQRLRDKFDNEVTKEVNSRVQTYGQEIQEWLKTMPTHHAEDE